MPGHDKTHFDRLKLGQILHMCLSDLHHRDNNIPYLYYSHVGYNSDFDGHRSTGQNIPPQRRRIHLLCISLCKSLECLYSCTHGDRLAKSCLSCSQGNQMDQRSSLSIWNLRTKFVVCIGESLYYNLFHNHCCFFKSHEQ